MNKIFLPDEQIKPINGGFISIQWEDKRHYYWNEACRKFTTEQWRDMIAQMAFLGQKYIIIFNVATGSTVVYDSKSHILPKADMVCDDPLEVILNACDEFGIKVFLNNDYYIMDNYDHEDAMMSKEAVKGRFTILGEIAEKYSHHKCFYGWYWAWESCITPYFPDVFMKYFNDTTAEARRLTPNAKFLTAPYGTRSAICDDRFVKQLDKLDCDIIAYQDTVGCLAMDTEQSKRSYEALRKAHDKVPQRKLWADVETFEWEGKDNRRDVALIPCEFDRLRSQLSALTPYVDEIVAFIFQGIFSNPDSISYTGYDKAAANYKTYKKWLETYHADWLKK